MASLVEPGKVFLESLMVDTCVLTRDRQGLADDVLNPETGVLVPRYEDTETLYEGKCILTYETRRMQEFVLNEVAPTTEQMYRVLIPLESKDVRVGDKFTVTAVGEGNDESMIGVEMRVTKVFGGTFRPARKFQVEFTDVDRENLRG